MTTNKPIFENAYEQMFYDSMAVQLEIAKDTKVDAKVRVEAADQIQRSYLTKLHAETHADAEKTLARTAGKALDQIKRLKDDD